MLEIALLFEHGSPGKAGPLLILRRAQAMHRQPGPGKHQGFGFGVQGSDLGIMVWGPDIENFGEAGAVARLGFVPASCKNTEKVGEKEIS